VSLRFYVGTQDPFVRTDVSALRRSGTDIVERKSHIPGYTGFIKNSEVRVHVPSRPVLYLLPVFIRHVGRRVRCVVSASTSPLCACHL
jgi:hypothetical protein